jgi:hypothetical protein
LSRLILETGRSPSEQSFSDFSVTPLVDRVSSRTDAKLMLKDFRHKVNQVDALAPPITTTTTTTLSELCVCVGGSPFRFASFPPTTKNGKTKQKHNQIHNTNTLTKRRNLKTQPL